jgi:protein-tyrosine phosphatase
MIDLHSHILPGIDDGPESLEISTQMAELYVKYGFTHVVATPHWVAGTSWTISTETIFERIAQLNHALENKSINISILAGMEIAIDIGLVDLLVGSRLLTLAGGPYVLIEAPFQRLPLGWEQMTFQIMAKGFRVLLAHPERCRHFYLEPDLLHKFIEAGGYLQANYDSFLGHYGPEVSKAAFSLIENGYLHLLATDSHDPLHRHPGHAFKAMEVLNKTAGPETVEILTHVNPRRVIDGLPLKTASPVSLLPKKRKKWWFF